MLKIFRSELLLDLAKNYLNARLISTGHVLKDTNKRAEDTTINFREKNAVNSLKRFIVDKIRISGPISVAEYMQICAAGSSVGYYSKKSGEIFGENGDFITSPEFTQMLGELLGVWAMYEVFKMGHKGQWQLIELGPGNGTLISDVLKVLSNFRLTDNVSVHLVETSERLMKKQAAVLCDDSENAINSIDYEKLNDGTLCKLSLKSKFGPVVNWYDDITAIPENFSVILAHEFFDALPVHKFRKTKNGWREIFVTIDEKNENLMFSMSPSPTLTQKAHFKEEYGENLENVEISPYSAVIFREIANRITSNGGASLIMDYGHVGDKGDTLRAFSRHSLVDPLSAPGEIDLTADVNFSYLLDTLKTEGRHKICHFGPISQAEFLKNLGLDLRFEQLMKKTKNEEEKRYLQKCYDILVNPLEMGERFKVLALFPKVMEEFFAVSPPSGFGKLR